MLLGVGTWEEGQPIRRGELLATAVPLAAGQPEGCSVAFKVLGALRAEPQQRVILKEAEASLWPSQLVVEWRGERGAQRIRFRNNGGAGELTELRERPVGIRGGWRFRELTCTGRIAAGAECEITIQPEAGAQRGRIEIYERRQFAGEVLIKP